MQDEVEFRRAAEAALDGLKHHLIKREEDTDAGLEVEEQAGALNVLFAGSGGRFVIAPNAPVRQIWISASGMSFQLDWDQKMEKFLLPRTGEPLVALVDRLIAEHLSG
jgi:iron donor protein CyaY